MPSLNHPSPTVRIVGFRKWSLPIVPLLAMLFVSFGCAARAAVIPDERDHVKSLDGVWRFKLEQRGGYDLQSTNGDHLMPIRLPVTFEPFQYNDYREDDAWTNLAVPGNWEMAGLSPATYDQPDNASGFYRLWFQVPADWEGRCVRLAFDGVQNGAEFWLNGSPVSVDEPSWSRENYHESGWTAFQVDLTPQVRFGKRNLLAIRVSKNTRSADLDSGDYFFLGGVYRTVKLFSVPQTHLEDVTVQTRRLDGGRAEVKVLATVTGGESSSLAMELGGVKGEAQTQVQNGPATLGQVVEHARLWSAEFPNLYPLTLKLKNRRGMTIETSRLRIGIREVSIKDGVFLINGVPVKLAGVCRHDLFPTEGTAVGPELWRKDILLMKAANINAIRTSHYPYGAGFYDLCDELGMYVVDELPYCWCHTDDPTLRPAFEQRARETVRRDKNHPSVIIWTIGNENKAGQNLQLVADMVKQLDSTRPRNVSCFDGDKYHVEFSDSHYSTPAQFPKQVKHAQAAGQPHIHLENPNTWDIRLAADPGMWEHWGPVLQREWDDCLKDDVVCGLFPFEWQDRAVADLCPVKLYTYYPDSGVNLLKIKGLVDGFRNPRPSLYEVKMVYSPVQVGTGLDIAADHVTFALTNRYSFTPLGDLSLLWKLEANGKQISCGRARIDQPPLSPRRVELPLPGTALARADTLQVQFIQANGIEVVAHRFILKGPSPASGLRAELPSALPIPRFNLVTRVTKHDPYLWRVVRRFPAHLANVVMDPSGAVTLAQLRALDAEVVGGTNNQVIGKLHAQYADGEFLYHLDWTGATADVQELGWVFDLPRDCDHFSWNRAARWTVYPRYDIGRDAGTATPDSMNVPLTRMDRPDAFDFNSTKYDCNWAALTTKSGAGLRVEFDPQQRFHCRGGIDSTGNGCVLFVNQQVSPPDDISKEVVPDFYLKPKAGWRTDGHFRVGSNPMPARSKPVSEKNAQPNRT